MRFPTYPTFEFDTYKYMETKTLSDHFLHFSTLSSLNDKEEVSLENITDILYTKPYEERLRFFNENSLYLSKREKAIYQEKFIDKNVQVFDGGNTNKTPRSEKKVDLEIVR